MIVDHHGNTKCYGQHGPREDYYHWSKGRENCMQKDIFIDNIYSGTSFTMENFLVNLLFV